DRSGAVAFGLEPRTNPVVGRLGRPRLLGGRRARFFLRLQSKRCGSLSGTFRGPSALPRSGCHSGDAVPKHSPAVAVLPAALRTCPRPACNREPESSRNPRLPRPSSCLLPGLRPPHLPYGSGASKLPRRASPRRTRAARERQRTRVLRAG